MKRKSIVTILTVVLMFVLSFTALVACNKEDKHEFAAEWTTDETSHWHVCTVEGHTDTDEKAVHTFDEGEITTPATENAEGVKTYTCTVCGYTKAETVAKLDHTHAFDTSIWKNDATWHWHPATCSHTNEKQDLEAHTFGEWAEKTPAGVHTDKVEHRFCSVCNYEETRIVENTATHTYATDWTKDATGHWHVSTCEHETPLKADFASHTFGDWTVKTPASDNADGVDHRLCSVCNYEETRIVEGSANKIYTISFVCGTGTVYRNLHYGEKISVPTDTPKSPDKTYSYTFTGWDKEITATCVGDAIYTAQYKATYIDYTVTFKDADGSVISTKKDYHYGDTVTVPEDPAKASNNTYRYTFSGWGKTVSATCDGNAEYTATYKEEYIKYTIKFVDWNDTLLSTKTYCYDQTVTIPSTTNLTRADDKICTGYTFAGWDKEVTTVKADTTYKATYTGTYIVYTIKFVDEDGTTILNEKTAYHYGDKVVVPTDPTKASDEDYSYPFTGWTPAVAETVEGSVTYTATYGKNTIEHLYTVTFLDYDGTEISKKADYHVGDIVTVPANPTRNADNTYTYTFNGWDKTVTTTCSGDATYTATYKEAYINYTIKFVDEDGTTVLLTKNDYHYGDTVTVPENPTKAEDETNTYVFKGWDKEVTTVAGNTTYKATYTANKIDYTVEYTITFVNDDGSIITSKTYHYNDTIDASDISPTKASSAQYNYTFSGWSPALSKVKGNVTYTAQYTSEERTYTITFVDERDTSIVFATQTYKYGETIDTSSITPTRETDKYAQYAFAYWSPSLTADTKVTGDATYRAVFNREYIYYTVRFVDWDGTEISSGSYYITQELTVPKNPTREADNTYTYNFDKWVDANGRTFNSSSCQGETVYTATYTQNYINYTVTFVDYDDTTLSTKTNYHYGDTVTAPTTPTRDADNTYTYTFAGWDKEITTVTGNTTYKATYTEAYINYTIKFVDEDGTTVLSKKTDYHYGDTITEPTTPTKDADETYTYTFAGWDKPVVDCAGNATYKATYTANKIDYVITFNMDGGSGGTESATAHYGEDMPAATAPTKSQSEFKGYYDENGVRYYDSEMNNVRTFDKTQNLTLTAKWSIIWAYTDETKTSIYFGYYPQTKVTDDTLISALNKLAGYNPNSGYLGNWTSYGYYEYGKVSDFMFYIDIDYDSDGSYDYRGVYFETYRSYTPTGTGGGASGDYSQLNGYIKQTKYWFKYEPIKWNILAEADGYVTVLADLLLDSQNFDFTSSTDYSSNYAESTIRAWLNSNFYNTAFTAMQKELIQTVTVDNSAKTNIDYSTTEVTATPCENTEDKVWLLSYQEAKTYSAIVKKTSTDYAKCQGINANVYNETYNGYSAWWLRSPQSDTYSYTVAETGVTTANAVPVQYTSIGVLPALKVKLA